MKTVDARGLLCPQPLILTKRAMAKQKPGTPMAVLIDNETSCLNLTDYLQQLHVPLTQTNEGTTIRIEFAVPAPQAVVEPEQVYGQAPAPYAVVIKSDRMGSGDDQLGQLLIRAFVNALPDTAKLPGTVILYNGGVKLARTGTDTAASLLKLQQMGVDIVVCGTCVDFFQLKDELAVGTISNMYRITELTSRAGHVVYP